MARGKHQLTGTLALVRHGTILTKRESRGAPREMALVLGEAASGTTRHRICKCVAYMGQPCIELRHALITPSKYLNQVSVLCYVGIRPSRVVSRTTKPPSVTTAYGDRARARGSEDSTCETAGGPTSKRNEWPWCMVKGCWEGIVRPYLIRLGAAITCRKSKPVHSPELRRTLKSVCANCGLRQPSESQQPHRA